MLNSIKKITAFVQYILSGKIKPGSTVLDGTMGNGNDTVFLAKLVGSEGKVIAFDIQALAIENTEHKIKSHNLDDYNIKLINDGHENIHDHIKEPIDGAMFNLGYLPSGDHSIITKPNSTIAGISSALDLLKPGGILSLVIYYGHEGGNEEKEKVLEFIRNIPQDKATVMECNYLNHHNQPPIIIFIEKNK